MVIIRASGTLKLCAYNPYGLGATLWKRFEEMGSHVNWRAMIPWPVIRNAEMLFHCRWRSVVMNYWKALKPSEASITCSAVIKKRR